MKKLNQFALICGAMSLLALNACESTVTDDADGTTEVDTTSGSDTGGGADTTTTDTSTGPKYTYVVVDGAPYTEPDCTKTTSAGPDLDAVLVYRGGKLIGAGKPGTPKEFKNSQPACVGVVRGTVADVAGSVNGKVYPDATPDTGYYSLSNNRVYVQIGACTQSSPDPLHCDGGGEVIELMTGDEIDIYEVDGTYKPGSGTPAAGLAPANCVCTAENYLVSIAVDTDDGGHILGASGYTGSKSQIPVTLP